MDTTFARGVVAVTDFHCAQVTFDRARKRADMGFHCVRGRLGHYAHCLDQRGHFVLVDSGALVHCGEYAAEVGGELG